MARLLLSSTMLVLLAASVVVISAFTLLKSRQQTVRRGCRRPPGPVPLPIVGNILSINGNKPWVTYSEWAARYGDIFTIRLFNQNAIVINSEKVARELLDRRSRIYSDRPYISTRAPYGWSFNFGLEPYGDQWRSQRRMFHQTFRAEAALTFYPTQLRKARQLVLDMLNTPQDHYNHIQRFSAALLLAAVYDYEVVPGSSDDHLVALLKRGSPPAMEAITLETASLVQTFPFLLSLPEWFPGAVIRRKAAISKDAVAQMIEETFEHVRKRQAAGSEASAMGLNLLKGVDDPSQLQLLKDTCATAFIAGTDTTTSTLRCFVLAMLQHQEVQERAQADIDAVVGRNRLPNFDDRPNLPYVEAVLLETLRIYPIGPLGVVHATSADDVYEDMFIAKGSTLVTNIWAMQRNKDIYTEPDTFKPERFLVDEKLREVKSVGSLSTALGGRHSADSTLWAAMVSILFAFKITKALNERGEEIEVKPTFSYSLIPVLEPFPCSITPRLPDGDIRALLSTADT